MVRLGAGGKRRCGATGGSREKGAEAVERPAEDREVCPTQPTIADFSTAKASWVEPHAQQTSAPTEKKGGAAERSRTGLDQYMKADDIRVEQDNTEPTPIKTSAATNHDRVATAPACKLPSSRLKRGAPKHRDAESGESTQKFRARHKKRMAFTTAKACLQAAESSSDVVSISEEEYQDSHEDDEEEDIPLKLVQEEASAELNELSDADSGTAKEHAHTTPDHPISGTRSGTKSDGSVPKGSVHRTKATKRVPDLVVVGQAGDDGGPNGGLCGEDTAIALLESSRGCVSEDDGAFMKGFDRVHETWDDFFSALKKHCDRTWQLLSKRTSYSANLRNKKLKQSGVPDSDPRLLPSNFPYYSLTLMCTHGIDHPKKGRGKHQRRIIRYLSCRAKVNALSQRDRDGVWKVKVSWESSNNHLRSEELFGYYAENRRITDPAVLLQAEKMKKAGASAKGILQYLREETGKLVCCYTHMKRSNAVSEATSCTTFLFVDIVGQHVVLNNGFRTGKNAKRVCVCGLLQGQYVHHSLVESEMADNLAFCLMDFKESNPAWVKVIVTDKDFNEKAVLAEAFPDARQLLCQFHVIDYLCKQRCRVLGISTRHAAVLGYDKKDAFFEYFEVNWETCKEEWVNYHRDNVPHLNNHTNNRIESGWRKIKQVVQHDDPIDELIGTLIMLQEWSEEGYMKEFRSLGTRQTPIAEAAADAELLTVAVQLSPHAYRLVRGQYKFACSAETAYEVKIDGTRVELRVPSEGGGNLRTFKRTKTSEQMLSRDQQYCVAATVCKQLQGIVADQSAADFKSTMNLLQTVERLCQAGDVRKLDDAMAVIESHVDGSKQKKQRHEESTPPSPHMKQEKNSTKIEWATDLPGCKEIPSSACQKTSPPDLTEVELLLSRQYSYDYAAILVELLPLKEVVINTKHTIQRMNMGQPVPQPTAILPRKECAAAIADIDMKVAGEVGNTVYVARWDQFGYAIVEQLRAMVLVIDARKAIPNVKSTLEWIDKLLMPSTGVSPPFDDCLEVPTVQNMALNKYIMAGEEVEGVRLLHFRGSEWLGSTCIRAGLIMLARRYVDKDVDIFMPDWYAYEDVPSQQTYAATHGAFHDNVERQIGVVNAEGLHWMAFCIDLTTDPASCVMFDPQQQTSRYNDLECVSTRLSFHNYVASVQ
ncbi:unnamed protein product [Phytophthora fragariaefolia]|uniref:Unnamed protein product n=1 Tax=Phytophthora fragariaefolia TaxID=1490495 RepID=A0A9W6TTU9_9STRA|nr:unnamed protein product [Phytophthora fragariaefolia]